MNKKNNNIEGKVGTIKEAYRVTKELEKGLCQMLVAGNGIEENNKIVASLIQLFKEEIEKSKLYIINFYYKLNVNKIL